MSISIKFVFISCLLTFSPLSFSTSIAITFDDAPTPTSVAYSGEERTRTLIANLQKANVKDALFFVTAQYLNNDSYKRLTAYQDAGFHIANHSFNHGSANKMEAADFLTDAYKAHLAIKDQPNFSGFFRFPYLHENGDPKIRQYLLNELDALGYQNGYVTVDNYDWYLNSRYIDAVTQDKKVNIDRLKKLYVDMLWDCIVFYDQIAKTTLGKSPQHILLLHENDLAAMFIDDLVEKIEQEGWKLVSPIKAYKRNRLLKDSPALTFNKQGRVAAIAHKKGVALANLRHPSESTEAIDALIQQYGIFE